ncbi:Ku protein [Ramlibacter henchirensis]|uniref:Non-homologous end joining protein Ku n=1 Tax=Ramlibacter henchirensis TaxID=204072 RepID=A0A4Z0BIT5_9BURK|nr:Ku protein [Ramlibacter henchirensis]TFY99245.1 Ku protein [Ramlibacter henchirensis]
MAAPAPTRALWKGSISFGLVFIPIALHSATVEVRPKMKMLDSETGAPVGYKKVDKVTGEAVSQADVVKGVEVDKGQYVTLTKDEIREALPKTTQTIEIESFVKLEEVPTIYFNKPYLTSPTGKAQKVYALLRDVLRRTGRVGVGRIVVSTKQHLALVLPHGDGLVVNLLRWHEEIRDQTGLQLPGDAKEVGLTDRELKMGEQLVLDLADEWHPERFRDEFAEKVQALIEAKRRAGEVKQVAEIMGDEAVPASAEVFDLTELLRRSLKGGAAPAPSRTPAPAPKKAAARSVKTAANDERERAAAAAKTTGKAKATVKASKRKSA